MAKKILKTETIAVSTTQPLKSKANIEETKKVDKALIYGEIPLRTYEMLRNSFIGIK